MEAGAERATDAFARVEAATRSSMNGDPGVHVVVRTYCLVLAGAIAEADELAQLVYDVAITRPGRQAAGVGGDAAGRGRPGPGSTARRPALVRRGRGGVGGRQLPGPARWCAIGCALAAALTGRSAEVEATLARADGYDGAGFGIWDPRRDRAQLWSAHLQGDGSVPARAAESVERARAVGTHQAALEQAHDLWRLGFGAEAAALVGGPPLEGARNAALRTVVEASAGDDVDAVAAAADDLEAMGCLLDAAEAMAHVARVHRRAGRSRPPSGLRPAARPSPVAAPGRPRRRWPRAVGRRGLGPRAPGGPAGRRRDDQPGHRPAPHRLGAHRREPPVPGLHQARHRVPRGAAPPPSRPSPEPAPTRPSLRRWRCRRARW